nr:hypothetical protein BaRGS_009207 [Batillaria attramentaria]
MAAIIVSLYALCFLGTMAYSFRWLPGTCIDHVTNVTHECIQVAQFVQDNMELWNALIEIPFNTSVPLVSLAGVTVANVIIAVRMRSVLAWRKETAHAIARQLVPDFVAGGRYNNIFYASLCISHLLESVNCSVNFVIYYTMSSKFNETLRGMFGRAGGGGGKKGRKEDTRSVLSKNSASETDNQTVASLA